MCCTSFLKIMMFLFNGGIFLAGAALLGLGIWVKVDVDSFLGILGESDLSALVGVSYALIAVGAVLLVIGFLGCCGAVKESRCMLLTFFSIVLIIFLIEIAGAVVLLVFRDVADDIFQVVAGEISQEIKENYGENDPFTDLWNQTMNQFQCCGYSNYTDFTGSPFHNDFGSYPDTCCWADNSNITFVTCDEETANRFHVEGCFSRVLALIEENSLIIAAVALGILALEIAAMVVSMVLYKNIGRKA